jgi:hypothetical protein
VRVLPQPVKHRQELLRKIPHADKFVKGDLCELVAKFGDPSAKPVIQIVLQTAQEPADRMQAAIALWELVDDSGVPVAITFLKAKDQPYGNWEEPIWFLMYARNAEAMKTLKAMVLDSSTPRAAEIVRTIERSITGNLWGKERKPAASVEICAVLIAAMERTEPSGETVNDIGQRLKDIAARAFARMLQGLGTELHREPELDRALFNDLEPDQRKRDTQIDALKQWYSQHKDHLRWDGKSRKLVIKAK